jgi:hypothetical protein
MPWRFQVPMSFTLFHVGWLWSCSFCPALSDWLSCLQISSARLHMRLWFRFPWQPKTETHMQTRRSEPCLGTSHVLQDWRLSKDMQLHSHNKCHNAMEVPTPKFSLSTPGLFSQRLLAIGWVHLCTAGLWLEAICTPLVNICGWVFYRSFFTDDSSSIWLCTYGLEKAKFWKMIHNLMLGLDRITQLIFWTWSA